MLHAANVSSVYFPAILFCCFLVSFPIESAMAQPLPCLPQGDVNQDGHLSPADARLAFQHFLGLVQLTACAQDQANVFAPATSGITPADALCIFQAFLELPSCVDQPIAHTGPAQTVTLPVGTTTTTVTLDGRGSSAKLGLAIVEFRWTGTPDPADVVQPTVTLGVGTFTFTLVVTDSAGATSAPSTVTITVNSPPLLTQSAEPCTCRGQPGDLVDLSVLISTKGNSTVLITNATGSIPQAGGQGVPNVLVTFTRTEGDGVFVLTATSTAAVRTDSNGIATVRFRLGARPLHVVQAQGQGVPEPPVVFTIVGFISPVGIAVEADGHLVVADNSRGVIVRIDPVSGAGTIISDAPGGFPQGIAVEADGRLLVTNGDGFAGSDFTSILRVDPHTGDRTVVSGSSNPPGSFTGTGQGPPLQGVSPSIVVEADGHLLVTGAFGAVLRVDPHTGDRAVVSGCTHFDGTTTWCTSPTGKGPRFYSLEHIAVEADGHLLVTDGGAILRVDPHTGDRTVVAGCILDFSTFTCTATVGHGPRLFNSEGIAVEADGHLVVTDGGAILRVDPRTGDRAVVSSCNNFANSTCTAVGQGPSFRSLTHIAVEANGHLVVTDNELSAVVRVDPVSGDRTIIAQGATTRGTGPPMNPQGLAVEADGHLVVTDRDIRAAVRGTVVRVDPVSGDRTLVSSCIFDFSKDICIATTSQGPPIRQPRCIAVEADGHLVMVDGNFAVLRVDPRTGNRTVVSGCILDLTTLACTATVGQGPSFRNPVGIAIEADGHLLVTDNIIQAILRVDPRTGNRTVVSGCTNIGCTATTGQGPPLNPQGIVVEADGHLVVTNGYTAHPILRVDPHTGNRTDLFGQGPFNRFHSFIAIEADGHLLVTDGGLRAVLRVDPHTGDRTIVSNDETGRGLFFRNPTFIAVEASGHLVVVDDLLQAVVRVDSHTGDRTLVSRVEDQ